MVQISKFEEELYKKGRKEDALNSLVSRFNKEVQDSNLFKELKEHEYYEKPSIKLRRKHLEAVIRWRRRQKELQEARNRQPVKRGGKNV